jgi:SET domain-containing protein
LYGQVSSNINLIILISGYGIFATKAIEKYEFILEYASQYISKSEALKREEIYSERGDGCYLFFYGSHG